MATHDVGWKVGAHTAFDGKICNTIWTAINFGMYATQFFLGSPQGFKRAVISENDITECKKILKKYPLSIFSHFPYVANFAGSIKSLAWAGDSAQDGKTKFMLKGLEYELGVLGNLDGGVVIHPGSFPDTERGLEAISSSINRITFPANSKLLLENSAGQGTTLARDLTQIQTILEGVDEKEREHVGVCIDTCHIYAAGQYDLSSIEGVDSLFEDFEQTIGMKKFWLLHLNDSEIRFNGKADKHACLGNGCIWKDSFDSLIHLLNKCDQYNIPIVLETHGSDMLTLSQLYKRS